jgi:hypothetical protein
MKAPRTWFPAPYQIYFGDATNSSWLHSMWVGFTAPLLNLPSMLWRAVIRPPIFGVWLILNFFIVSAIAGLRGKVHGYLVDAQAMTDAVAEAEDTNQTKP